MFYLSPLNRGFRLKKYLQLAAQIIRKGTLHGSGQNFNATRVESLENLVEFIPQHSKPKHGYKSIRVSKSFVNNLIAQAAFIKSSFQYKGGHINVQGLSYIRIPKSANTSVSHAMLVKKYPALKDKNADETQINFLADVNLQQISKAGNENFFTVVRNPFARLVSVYRDFFETNREEFIYTDYLFGILPKTLSFAEFVNRISTIPDRLKDQHFKPQHYFFKPYERKGIGIKVFRLEESEHLKDFLAAQGMELTHRNKSPEAYNYTQYYNASLLEAVHTIYEADIKKFGYEQVYDELKTQVRSY